MPPPPVPPTARPAPIRAWRCVRHAEREAAARCPVCGQPFCRECVVEHEGRLLCSACLAKQASPAPAPRAARSFAPLRALLSVGTPALVLWFVFFYAATLLTRIPQNFHDATIWKDLPGPQHDKPARKDKSPTSRHLPHPTNPRNRPTAPARRPRPTTSPAPRSRPPDERPGPCLPPRRTVCTRIGRGIGPPPAPHPGGNLRDLLCWRCTVGGRRPLFLGSRLLVRPRCR
ncbi:MAG: hypothetical protein IPL39_04725 [Opitutaceae bacterium]|nr:hypothetical protein [Opitutaceae bacterium]